MISIIKIATIIMELRCFLTLGCGRLSIGDMFYNDGVSQNSINEFCG